MVQNNVITDHILRPVIETFYWIVPHQLLSNLERDITISNVHATCEGGCPFIQAHSGYLDELLARIPFASGTNDIVHWFAYLAVLCVILHLALRRKQV